MTFGWLTKYVSAIDQKLKFKTAFISRICFAIYCTKSIFIVANDCRKANQMKSQTREQNQMHDTKYIFRLNFWFI